MCGAAVFPRRHTAQLLGLPTTLTTDYLNFVLLTSCHAGILLNFSGYGYRFSAERGVEIGTLAEVRSAFAEGAYTSYVLLSTFYFLLSTSYFLLATYYSLLTKVRSSFAERRFEEGFLEPK